MPRSFRFASSLFASVVASSFFACGTSSLQAYSQTHTAFSASTAIARSQRIETCSSPAQPAEDSSAAVFAEATNRYREGLVLLSASGRWAFHRDFEQVDGFEERGEHRVPSSHRLEHFRLIDTHTEQEVLRYEDPTSEEKRHWTRSSDYVGTWVQAAFSHDDRLLYMLRRYQRAHASDTAEVLITDLRTRETLRFALDANSACHGAASCTESWADSSDLGSRDFSSIFPAHDGLGLLILGYRNPIEIQASEDQAGEVPLEAYISRLRFDANGGVQIESLRLDDIPRPSDFLALDASVPFQSRVSPLFLDAALSNDGSELAFATSDGFAIRMATHSMNVLAVRPSGFRIANPHSYLPSKHSPVSYTPNGSAWIYMARDGSHVLFESLANSSLSSAHELLDLDDFFSTTSATEGDHSHHLAAAMHFSWRGSDLRIETSRGALTQACSIESTLDSVEHDGKGLRR